MTATIADAIKARIESVAPSGVLVYDNEVPARPADRYWVLYCGVGIWTATTYSAAYVDNSATFQLTTVASDQAGQQVAAQMCRWLESRGIAALLGWRPVVAGLSCGSISQVQLDNWPAVDQAVLEIPTVYAVDRFTVRAFVS